MAPYIALSHVQYEINTEAPAVKKTTEKLPDACDVFSGSRVYHETGSRYLGVFTSGVYKNVLVFLRYFQINAVSMPNFCVVGACTCVILPRSLPLADTAALRESRIYSAHSTE